MEETKETDWIVESLIFAAVILLPLVLFWFGFVSRWIALIIWAVVGVAVCWYCFFQTPRLLQSKRVDEVER